MDKNKVIKFKKIAGTKFLNLYNVEYKNKMGKIKEWIIASRKDEKILNEQYFNNKNDNIDGVVIVAFHEEAKKLVIIKQYRVPINNYVYELVAGLVDSGEDIKTTVCREIKEETGLDVVEITNKGNNKVYVSPGMTDEALALVYCKCTGEISKKYLEEDEDIETMLISQDAAREIMNSNKKIDVKCFLALQSFAELGEKLFS